MRSRRVASVALSVFASFALVVCVTGEMQILWRALVLSWDRPATQAQDELGVQAVTYADVRRDAHRAALPVPDDGAPHVGDGTLGRPRRTAPDRLTRSPPSA